MTKEQLKKDLDFDQWSHSLTDDELDNEIAKATHKNTMKLLERVKRFRENIKKAKG